MSNMIQVQYCTINECIHFRDKSQNPFILILAMFVPLGHKADLVMCILRLDEIWTDRTGCPVNVLDIIDHLCLFKETHEPTSLEQVLLQCHCLTACIGVRHAGHISDLLCAINLVFIHFWTMLYF